MKVVALALAVSLLATACFGGSAARTSVPRTSTFGPSNPVRARLLAEAHAARNPCLSIQGICAWSGPFETGPALVASLRRAHPAIPVVVYGRGAGPPRNGVWVMPGSTTNHLELETAAPGGQLWDLFAHGSACRFARVAHG